LAVHLTQGQMLPDARAAELIQGLYGLAVSPATQLAWLGEARVGCRAMACSKYYSPPSPVILSSLPRIC